MNRLLIVAILIIGTLPLYAQGQQPNSAELAQKVVGIITGDKTETVIPAAKSSVALQSQ